MGGVDAGATAARWMGIRRAAVIELAVLFAAALCADRFLLQSDRFWNVTPHPFGMIVLLVSAQYGTAEGLLAAALATAALLAFNLPEPVLGADRYAVALDLARRPMWWFISAVVLGELTRRRARREGRLRSDLADARRREEDAREACGEFRSSLDLLQRRMAGQPATVLNLCRAATRLERLDPDQALEGAMEVVTAVMRPRKFSLFLRKGNALDLVHQEGWETGDPWSRSLAAASPLAVAMLERGRPVCAAVSGDETLLGGEGVLACPLRDPATGHALGMLKVEDLDFALLHETHARTFEFLADWISAVYAQSRLHQSLLGRLAEDPAEAAHASDHGVGSPRG